MIGVYESIIHFYKFNYLLGTKFVLYTYEGDKEYCPDHGMMGLYSLYQPKESILNP